MRFVVLAHALPGFHGRRPDHWDVLFETTAGALRGWRVPVGWPAGAWLPAGELPLHRLAHLWRQGATSSGVGWTARLDRGTFRAFADSPTRFAAALAGARFRGVLTVERRGRGLWQARRELFLAAPA